MTVEAADYISQLDPTLPATGDPKSEGDNHIRLIKEVLQTQFPDLGEGPMPKIAGRNAFINGEFLLARRGTSFAAVADNTYTLERWVYRKSGTMVHTVSQDFSDVPTPAQAGLALGASLKLELTTPDGAIDATDFCYIGQRIEGYNFARLARRTMTVSFWTKATLAGSYSVSARNAGVDASYNGEFVINAANTWERKTVTLEATPATGTWNYRTGMGLIVSIALAAGANYRAAPNVWNTDERLATINQVNGCQAGATFFRLAGLQIEPGSVASEFEQRQYQIEELLCDRYFQPFIADVANQRFAMGYWTSATRVQALLELPRVMRTAPTVTYAAAGNFLVRTAAGAGAAVTAIATALASPRSVDIQADFGAGTSTAGQGSMLMSNGLNGTIYCDAEL